MSYACLSLARVPTAAGAADHPDQLADKAKSIAERAEEGAGPLAARHSIAELAAC